MRKKSHDRILREELKEQHLNTIPKSCPKTETIASTRVHKSLMACLDGGGKEGKWRRVE